jgi:hypothetical protein
MNKPMSHADIIRYHLSKAELSQRAAARELGIDERTMRRYCTGELLVPPLVILALQQVAQRLRNSQVIALIDDGKLSTSDGDVTREMLLEHNEKLRQATEFLVGRADLLWERIPTVEFVENSSEQHQVTRFKSLLDALKEMEPFIRNGKHLQTGRPFKQLDDLRSREILANWLVCVAVNSVTQGDRLTFTSDPVDGPEGGDGIIYDSHTSETWRTEHVMVPNLPNSKAEDLEAQILDKVNHKWNRGADYATGKTLVVFLNVAGEPWFPNKVARRLPSPLHFNNVWVVGLNGVDDGEYVYNVTRLSEGGAPVWRVRIGKDFDTWRVEQVQ